MTAPGSDPWAERPAPAEPTWLARLVALEDDEHDEQCPCNSESEDQP